MRRATSSRCTSARHSHATPVLAVLYIGIASAVSFGGEYRTMRYTTRPADSAKAWQTDIRARLFTALKLDDLMRDRESITLGPRRLSSTEKGSYRVEELEINSTPGRRIRIVVTAPSAQAGLRPAVVCIGGHGSDLYSPYDANTVARQPAKAKADRIYRGFGTLLAAKGYATISTTVSQHEIRASGRLLMGERLWDLMRCVDYLESLPQVDKARIGCAGLSLGGEMAMWLGAMDGDISASGYEKILWRGYRQR